MIKVKEIITPISLAGIIVDKNEAYQVVRENNADPVTIEIEYDNFTKCSEIIERVTKSKVFNN